MQDLTPELRTRLSRVERAVGVFVLLATVVLLTGFAWYLYKTGERKGWFVLKVSYATSLYDATGLKEGDPVKLMGFDVGEITRITGQRPEDLYNVYVEFTVRAPYFGYIWTGGSKARVNPTDFLGKRVIEATKGTNYMPTFLTWEVRSYSLAEAQALAGNRNQLLLDAVRDPASLTNASLPRWMTLRPIDADVLAKLAQEGIQTLRVANRGVELDRITAVWDLEKNEYVPPAAAPKAYWLQPDETPALTDQLGAVIRETEAALTNQFAAILTNLTLLSSNANAALVEARPLLSNLTAISGSLRDPDGSLGRWALPPDLYAQLLLASTNANGLLTTAGVALTNTSSVLTNAGLVLTAANANLAEFVARLQPPLEQLTGIASNLHSQVGANTNFITSLHQLMVDTDDMVQGLKRHWLLRGAFKQKPPPKPKSTNAPPPLYSPRAADLLRR